MLCRPLCAMASKRKGIQSKDALRDDASGLVVRIALLSRAAVLIAALVCKMINGPDPPACPNLLHAQLRLLIPLRAGEHDPRRRL